jgi:dephospho-CoA kinase
MIVGLTGGVASGKNLVAGELKRLGAFIVDADGFARRAVERGKPAYKAIVREFGKDIVLRNKRIDRKKLGSIVFSDKRKLKKLNAITHPPIIREIRKTLKKLKRENPASLIVLNAPLLIEAGLDREMDSTIVVYAAGAQQTERVMKRDGLTEKQALQRVRAQMPLKKKLRYADFVVDNTGSRAGALRETRRIYSILKAMQE